MLIELNMRHIPKPGESARSRHEIGVQSIRAAKGMTKRYAGDLLCVLEFADEGDEKSSGGSNLTPICADGVTAVADYGMRYPSMPDMAMYDDSIVLKFDPEKLDYREFVHESMPAMIGHFSSYRADLHLNLDLAGSDFDRANKAYIRERIDMDYRRVVLRINPVNYFDRGLCERAFNTTPEAIMEALAGQVERVEMLEDGVLIVVTSELIDRPEIEAIDPRIRPLINKTPAW